MTWRLIHSARHSSGYHLKNCASLMRTPGTGRPLSRSASSYNSSIEMFQMSSVSSARRARVRGCAMAADKLPLLSRITPHRREHVAVPAGDRQRDDGLFRTSRRELVVELVDKRSRGPGGAVGQAADRRAGHDAHRLLQLDQHVEVAGAAHA